MHSILARNLYFIKEHVGFLKAANNYDVLDPESQDLLMECREENLKGFAKLLRFTKYKTMTPFDFAIKRPNGEKVMRIKRAGSWWGTKAIEIFDENEQLVGSLKRKMWSFRGRFLVLNPKGEEVCVVNGKIFKWEFKFLSDNSKNANEYATISKKWAGLGKELFTTADNYMLSINQSLPTDAPIRMLILGAVMSIDMIFAEMN